MKNTMTVKGIMFDKDGTILDFNRLWTGITQSVAENICERYVNDNLFAKNILTPDMIKSELGIKNGNIDGKSPLAYMTYIQMADIIYDKYADIIPDTKMCFEKIFEEEYEKIFEYEEYECIPTCNIKELFKELKSKNIKIGLATADNRNITEKCLKKMGIYECFDYIGCDDGKVNPKPCTDMFDIFSQKYGLKNNEVIICGDTVNDMIFAKNCNAIAVAVLCGLGKYDEIKDLAEYVIDSPKEITKYI